MGAPYIYPPNLNTLLTLLLKKNDSFVKLLNHNNGNKISSI